VTCEVTSMTTAYISEVVIPRFIRDYAPVMGYGGTVNQPFYSFLFFALRLILPRMYPRVDIDRVGTRLSLRSSDISSLF
jgi:hypothetical protein